MLRATRNVVLVMGCMGMAVLLANCGDDSGTSVQEPAAPAAAPSAPALTLSAGLKQLVFSWTESADATYYQLQDDPDGLGAYVQVGADIAAPASSATEDIPVHLLNWSAGQMRVRACNDAGCGDSAPAAISPYMLSTIGYLKSSNTGAGDGFGQRVALSADGNTLAVNAQYEDSAATGINGNQADNSATDSGAVYVFVRAVDGAWSQQAYLKASNAGAGDVFSVVALSGDGNTLAVGAYQEDSIVTGIIPGSPNEGATANGALESGAVYVFTRSGSTWSQQAYVKASNTGASDRFGLAVALSYDGNTMAVTADLESSAVTGIGGNQADNTAPGAGAAYVFTRSGIAWSQQAYIKASNTGADDNFGYFYVALSSDGNTLVVGAPGEDSAATGTGGNQADNSATDSGAVYVFRRSGSTWSQQAYLKASNTGAGDLFGQIGVALSADGSILAVSAPGEDSAATGIGGLQSDNNAADSGAAYVFTFNGSAWSQQAYVKASNTGAGDGFGYGPAISADGSILAVNARYEDSAATGIGGNEANNTAPDSAAVYLFTRNGATWSQRAYIKAPNTGAGDYFTAMYLSADGSTLVVGAAGEDGAAIGIGGDQTSNAAPDAGAVYLY